MEPLRPMLAESHPYSSTSALAVGSQPPRRIGQKKGPDPHLDRIISRTRLFIRILSLLLSVSIVGILSYIVVLYTKTKGEYVQDEQLKTKFKVWSSQLNISPTLILLGGAAAAAFLNLLLCIANFSKAVRRVTSVGNILTMIVSTVAIILWLGVGTWYKIGDMNAKKHYDMLSYVCTRHRDSNLTKKVADFGVLCSGMRYSWWAVVAVASLELIAIGTVAWGVWASGRRGAYSKI
ncbi:hypothetical protein B0J13DRAFT_534855 [Dactylonectria estremocensis]|uniref:Uncharacterized protein n=1 Tax=Dactylonectria estremocensis TaxID=1079267 RepID=A0A9P9CXU7_9HYPO|nr:hypothetical protein B0J13DRAFT_534855 [Dactylonectria estremocensis]